MDGATSNSVPNPDSNPDPNHHQPIIARYSQLFLVDVDKKGNLPSKNQEQHWLCTFKGKTDTGLTSVTIRIRVNNQGDQIEGWALYMPDTDFVQSFIDFPPPPASQVGFDSSTAVVVNSVFQAKQDLQVYTPSNPLSSQF